MSGATTTVVQRVEAVIDLGGKATLYITLVMIALVATNVLLRYSLSLGTVWSQELEWHLLAALILLGISYSLQRGNNVRVDVFYVNFSPRTQFIVNLVSHALLLVIAALFVKLSLAYVMQSYSIGERSSDPGGIPYRWAVKALIPIGFGLLALQTAAAIARLFLNERQRHESASV